MNEVVEQAQDVRPGPIVHTPAEPRQLTVVEYAVQRGASVQEVRALVELQVQMDNHKLAMLQAQADMARADRAEAAVQAYSDAMAEFKKNPPTILKDKNVNYTSAKGTTNYNHATHFAVTTAIGKALALHGLSHSWRSAQANGEITITCTIKHVLGHSDSDSMTGPYDMSGGKNPIQGVASARHLLERYTLLGITGMSTQDLPDDDGASSASPQVVEGVLQGLLADVAKAADDAAAVALWNSGKKTLASLGDTTAAEEFKAALAARRRAIKGATC